MLCEGWDQLLQTGSEKHLKWSIHHLGAYAEPCAGCSAKKGSQRPASSRVDKKEALVAQDAGVVHDEGARLLREVAEADRVAGLPPRVQLCFPLLLELVQLSVDKLFTSSVPIA